MIPDAEAHRLSRVSAPSVRTARETADARVPAAILSAGLLWGLGILIPNIMPVVFQALHQARGLTESQLGGVAAAFVLGSGLPSVTGPFWVRRTDLRLLSLASVVLASAALIVVALQTSAAAISLGWFVIGMATGGFGTPAFAALGDTANPVRTYSLALFASSVLAAVLSFALPLLVLPRFGGDGVILALAALFALAIPSAFATPRRQRPSPAVPRTGDLVPEPRHAVGPGWQAAAAPILASAAGAVFTGVLMGAVYNFVGSFAAADGIDGRAVGVFVGAALLSSLVGSLAPSFLGRRFGPAAMISLSSLAMLLTYPGMLSHSTLVFGVCFAVNMAFSTFGYTYFLALVRELDPTNRIYIAYPAAMSLGISVLTAGAGAILSHASPAVLLLVVGILVAASVAAARIALKTQGGTPAGARLKPEPPSRSAPNHLKVDREII